MLNAALTGSCPSMRSDVVLSIDRDHELTISSPTSWPRCAHGRINGVSVLVQSAAYMVSISKLGARNQHRGVRGQSPLRSGIRALGPLLGLRACALQGTGGYIFIYYIINLPPAFRLDP